MVLLFCARHGFLLLLLSVVSFAQRTLSGDDLARLISKSKSGDAESQIKLGTAYQFGTGVQQDLKQAEKWYKAAAGFGNPVAQTQLGMLYLQPSMREQHVKEAVQWFLRAAASKFGPAEYSLGLVYRRGWGVAANSREAERWYRKAASHGFRPAEINLAMVLMNSGDHDRHAEAFQLLTKSSKSGNREAWSPLGVCYEQGLGVKQDHTEAVRWYMKSAKAGIVDGMHNFGVMLYSGDGIQQNREEAFRWESRACEKADIRSCGMIAYFYYMGHGVKQDHLLAYRYALISEVDGKTLNSMAAKLDPVQQAKVTDEAEEWRRAHLIELSVLPQDNTPNVGE